MKLLRTHNAMKRLTLAFALLTVCFSASGCSKPVVPVETARLVLPDDIGPILVLVDRLPGKENFVKARAEQVAIGLRHFSAQTSWGYVDDTPVEEVESASAVVYLGLNGNDPLSPDALTRLRAARRLIVSRYHLARLREAGIAFSHTEGGKDVAAPGKTVVHYNGKSFRSTAPDFLDFQAKEGAQVLVDYSVNLPNEASPPYVIQDGNALFVNGEISFDSNDVAKRGVMLATLDALTRFLSAHPLPERHVAMLRVEDVSALTPASQLDSIVQYLAEARVPYGIGIIPDLHIKGKSTPALRDNNRLVNVLRWAESHGATIILHGLHHCCSSEDAEGYEFWDRDNNAAVSHDSAEWMRAQIAQGIEHLSALGLHPKIWETPHYSASPVDYGVVSEFFGVAWELRRPVGWLPWVLKRDQYGTLLLPENLGYVALDGKQTVADQLARARELLVCSSCIAVGYLHPSTIRLEDVRDYVNGLRDLGYAFVDPADAVPSLQNAHQ